ncbi:hypothetical protein [Cyclobacterium jeungdonense]|uniref:Lipocalin-like domain-containing protein n=1 Tax=Cyclobacterium jeungdonense TaxID=708087 RepID=A0ABT8CC04_9BACT|nr:hypothetical protein [Cyclobacterium jeungdonense]MDN3689206.1 hypothetical protein [Cyclobacterium jeungdonense]
MKKELNFITLCMLLLLSFRTYAQKEEVIGFWAVEKVMVGEESMTPVAKWFRINSDGSYQAGNGWLQNGQGSWQYDAENNLYSPKVDLDVANEFGSFRVSFEKEKMFWERTEEGMPVKVTLVPIETLPMSPADYLEGIWDLVDITENEQSILAAFDGNNKHKLFIRWDRIYINFNPEGKRLTGYWHIHGHRPEITLLPHQEGVEAESWEIEVNEKELLMSGISDSNRNIKRKYVRRNTF